jgi:hypothetical protein
MQISAVQSNYGSVQSVGGGNSFAQVKKDFEALGNALNAGNLDEAKQAFAQLQKDAPAPAGKNNPLSDTIQSLGKALDSGDLKSAQDAYSKIEKTISQRPPGRGPGGPGGPGGQASDASGASRAGGAGGGSQSNKTYDKMDTNQDGTVSTQEALMYEITHSADKKGESTQPKSESTANDAGGGTLDIQV